MMLGSMESSKRGFSTGRSSPGDLHLASFSLPPGNKSPSCSTCHNFKVNRLEARGLRMPLTAVKMAKAKSWNCESREILSTKTQKIRWFFKDDHLIVVLRFIFTYTFFCVYVWKHFLGMANFLWRKKPGTCGLKLCLKGWDGVAMHVWMTHYISTKAVCTFFSAQKSLKTQITRNYCIHSCSLWSRMWEILRILHTCTKKGF